MTTAHEVDEALAGLEAVVRRREEMRDLAVRTGTTVADKLDAIARMLYLLNGAVVRSSDEWNDNGDGMIALDAMEQAFGWVTVLPNGDRENTLRHPFFDQDDKVPS